MGLAATIPNWQTIRRKALDRDGWRCRRCGKAGRLEVHHKRRLIDGGSNAPGNLETLCVDCHKTAHRRAVSPARADWQRAVAELAG